MVGITMVMKFKVVEHVINGESWKRAIRMTNAIRGKPQEADEVYRWCNKQFGPVPSDNTVKWCCSYDGYSAYYFRDPADCAWFLLKWS